MIRFVTELPKSGNQVTLGLALLPTDLAKLVSGELLFTTMEQTAIEPSQLKHVVVCAVRDERELRELLRSAGVDPKMIGMPEVVPL